MKSIEDRAASLFRKMEHLDPTEDCDINADDWGWSKLSDRKKHFYEMLIKHVDMDREHSR